MLAALATVSAAEQLTTLLCLENHFTIAGQSLWCLESLYHRKHSEPSFHPSAVSLTVIDVNAGGWVPRLEVLLHSTAEKLACKRAKVPSTQLDLNDFLITLDFTT